MRFVSTRNAEKSVSFKQALLNPMPADGGLYVPQSAEDLRHWVYYTKKDTSFASIAGSLTSALINEEFSPIICETIATHAFTFEPVLKKLGENIYVLELFHGPTGSPKDFGVSYLTSCLETILQYDEQKSILLDATAGELGACMASAMRGKRLLKSVLLCPKGKLRGMKESDFVWNGGNIYPVEIDGDENDCHNIIRRIFADRSLVEKYHLTVANTANIGRLLPQEFYYTYAFSRLKEELTDEIYYAMTAGNYGNMVAGLYSWQYSLPVNGFVIPSTDNLRVDSMGQCQVLDSVVPFEKRAAVDPSDPSNLERLESLFHNAAPMLKEFVFPANITAADKVAACKELFVKYGYFANESISSAYASVLKQQDLFDEGGAVVLFARRAPSRSAEFIKANIGESVERPQNVAAAFEPVVLDRPPVAANDVDKIISILNSLNLLRIF